MYDSQSEPVQAQTTLQRQLLSKTAVPRTLEIAAETKSLVERDFHCTQPRSGGVRCLTDS